jgi:NADH:ubiquinone oxidoreductase subunit 5 (subunit L)/multisubunit Na+/H+ antiporter MnhA subunit
MISFLTNKTIILLGIIFMPLVSFTILIFFGRFLGRKGAHVIAPLFIAVALLSSIFTFKNIAIVGNFAYVNLGI